MLNAALARPTRRSKVSCQLGMKCGLTCRLRMLPFKVDGLIRRVPPYCNMFKNYVVYVLLFASWRISSKRMVSKHMVYM